MDEIKKSCLLTEIQMMGHLWEDDQLRESVKSAIMAENIEDLARIISYPINPTRSIKMW